MTTPKRTSRRHDRPRGAARTIAVAVALALAAAMAAPAVLAADALRGKALYASTNGAALSCGDSSCHGPNPSSNRNKTLRGANNGPLIASAISRNTGGMGFLGPYVNATDAADIGAYIANPTVTGGAVASVSPTSITFPGTSVGTTGAASLVTVSNTGTSVLSLASASLGGTHAGDWTVPAGGTCVFPGSVAAGASCTVAIAFRPTAGGARSASLAIAHGAGGSPTNVALAGTGSTTPQPSITLSATSIDFGAVVVGTASAARPIVVGNAGNATLTLGTIGTSGAQAAEFARAGGDCAASVAPGASCTITVVFTPAALGARAGTLSIASNAPAGAASVPLAGTGQPAPVPGAALSPATLTFGNATVGADAPPRAVVLTNDGTAPLSVGTPTVSPSNAGFTVSSGTCAATLAAGASCTLRIGFRPPAAGARSATLSLPSNAPGSPDTAALSGTGVAGPTAAPVLSDAGPLVFAATPVGGRTAARTVSIENRGAAATRLTAIAVSGVNAGDFQRGGTCATGVELAPAAACTITIEFAPSAAGPRRATVTSSSDSGAQLELAVDGTGTAVAAAPAATPTGADPASVGTDEPAAPPVNIGAGGCTMMSSDTVDPLLPTLLLASGLALALRRARAARRPPIDR